MKTKAKEKFEKIVYDSLKEAGLIFPITDEEIEQFEDKFTRLPLPAKLRDPEAILLRNQEKIQSAQQPTLQVASLFDADDESTTNPQRSTGKKKKDSKKRNK